MIPLDLLLAEERGRVFPAPPVDSVLYLPMYPPLVSPTRDWSGQGNHGTITGATWKRLGSGLWYLDFDGTTNKVVVGGVTTFKWLHGAEDTTGFKFTIKMWVKVTSWIDDILGLLETGAGSASSVGVTLWIDNRSAVPRSRRIMGLVANGSGTNIVDPDALDNSYPNDALWHHLVWTHDQSLANTNTVVYLDTVVKDTEDKTVQTPSTANPVQALEIGRVANSFTHYGSIALMQIVKNVVWTAGQVADNRNQEKHLFGV